MVSIMIELIALFSGVSSIVFVIFVVIVLVMIVRRTGRRPQARGLFTRRCPNCRDIIPDRATICPNCHGATGFGRSTVGSEKPPLPKRDFGLRGPEEEATFQARVASRKLATEKQAEEQKEQVKLTIALIAVAVAVAAFLLWRTSAPAAAEQSSSTTCSPADIQVLQADWRRLASPDTDRIKVVR
jgi:hypothetical protein